MIEPNDIIAYWSEMLEQNCELLKIAEQSGKATETEIRNLKNIIKYLEGLTGEHKH